MTAVGEQTAHGRDVPPEVAPRRITHELLADVEGTFHATVVPTEPGVVAATAHAVPPSGIAAGEWKLLRAEGDRVPEHTPVLSVYGSAIEIMVASDHVLGVLGFAGGLARRACDLVAASPPEIRIVCGGWKKLPATMKPVLRDALSVAGVGHRLVDGPFVYVDKNAVHLSGDVRRAVRAGLRLDHGPVAVQVTSAEQAVAAASAGAAIVMVDTGDLRDLVQARRALADPRLPATRVAFGGGATIDVIAAAARHGAAIVDVGRAILDAPIWDLRLTVS